MAVAAVSWRVREEICAGYEDGHEEIRANFERGRFAHSLALVMSSSALWSENMQNSVHQT